MAACFLVPSVIMLIQLIYASAASRPISQLELELLLTKSRQKNQLLGISGMLAYHEGSFLQVLEGKELLVDVLYDQISQDDRHEHCKVLLRTFVDQRHFADWSMGFVNTKLYDLQKLAGYEDLFRPGFSFDSAAPSVAQRLLLGFRDGLWHEKVEA